MSLNVILGRSNTGKECKLAYCLLQGRHNGENAHAGYGKNCNG